MKPALWTLLLCNVVACAGPQQPPAPAVAPSPAAADEAPQAAAATSAPEERTLAADTKLTTPAGASFTASRGWHLVRHPGYLVLLEPDHELSIALVELKAAGGATAIAGAWKRVDPAFRLPVRRRTTPPPRRGWDEVTQIDYEAPTAASRLALALARRKGRLWYVALLDGKKAAFDRRGAQAVTVLRSFRAPGVEEEDWAGRQAHRLEGERLRAFEAFVEQARRQAEVPGAAVAVVQGGRVALARGFGVRGPRKRPVTPQTLFMIGSTTKSLTTLMMAVLVDQQRFGWDTPVTRVLPDFALADPEVTRKLTVENTVCACAGLPRQDLEFLFEYHGVTPEQRMAAMKSMKPTTGFGETFQYSNSMVAAGGYVAAHALYPRLKLGPAYDRAMRRLVFKPLGMTHTTLSFATAARAEHAMPYAHDLRLRYRPITLDEEKGVYSVRPAGAAWSSARDMARYLLLELGKGQLPGGKRVVSAEALLERRKPRVKITNRLHYGLGLFVERDHGVKLVHHGGNNLGFTSDMFLLPDHDVGAVLLTNAGDANAFRKAVRRRLLELLFDGRQQAGENLSFALKKLRDEVKRELERVDDSPDRAWLPGLAGRYENPALGPITVALSQTGATLDAGEWKSAVGRKREPDGTLKLILLEPPLAGLELLPKRDGQQVSLLLEMGQHRYLFRPAGKNATH